MKEARFYINPFPQLPVLKSFQFENNDMRIWERASPGMDDTCYQRNWGHRSGFLISVIKQFKSGLRRIFKDKFTWACKQNQAIILVAPWRRKMANRKRESHAIWFELPCPTMQVRQAAILKNNNNKQGGIRVDILSGMSWTDKGFRRAGRLNPAACPCSIIDYTEGWDSVKEKYIISLRIIIPPIFLKWLRANQPSWRLTPWPSDLLV